MTEEASNTQEAMGPRPGESDEQYAQRMADKYRSQSSLDGDVEPPEGDQKPNVVARPDNVPEKFWDAEKGEVRMDDVLKAHSELEKKLSQRASPKPPESGEPASGKPAEGEQPNGEQTPPDPYVEGVKSFSAAREEATALLAEGKELTDEVYQKFEKHGLSREDVDAFVAGQEAMGQLARMQVYGEVGGEDNYKSMIEWARGNFEKAEIEVYDRDIHSADPAVRLTAARGLAARFAQANGEGGNSVTSGHVQRGMNGYASGAEMRAEMRDPRYEKDEAFRAQVARKVAASRAAGIDLSA